MQDVKIRRLSLGSNGDANSKSRQASTKTWKTVASVPQSTTKVSINDPKEKDDPVWTASESNDDSDREEAAGNNNDDASTITTKNTEGKKRRTKVRRNPVLRKAKTSKSVPNPHRLVWETGTAGTVIGGTGWHITRQWNHKISLNSALFGMETVQNLPMLATVTAADTSSGTHLLGIRVGAYGKRPEQDESLVKNQFYLLRYR